MHPGESLSTHANKAEICEVSFPHPDSTSSIANVYLRWFGQHIKWSVKSTYHHPSPTRSRPDLSALYTSTGFLVLEKFLLIYINIKLNQNDQGPQYQLWLWLCQINNLLYHSSTGMVSAWAHTTPNHTNNSCLLINPCPKYEARWEKPQILKYT